MVRRAVVSAACSSLGFASQWLQHALPCAGPGAEHARGGSRDEFSPVLGHVREVLNDALSVDLGVVDGASLCCEAHIAA